MVILLQLYLGHELYALVVWDDSSITSAKRWVGGVRKWQFLLIYSTVHADVGGWTKVIYTKYSKHSNETNTFMGLGRTGRFGQS